MAAKENGEILSLMYVCLKDLHLMKTARCLQEESGQNFSSPPEISLKRMLKTYKSVSTLISEFVNYTGNNKTASQKSSSSDNKNDSVEKITKPKREPKPKRVPLVPPGEWVHPEMEDALCLVFDKLRKKDGTNTQRLCGSINLEPSKSDLESTLLVKDASELGETSEDDTGPVRVKLSNGIVFDTPSAKKTPKKSEEKTKKEELSMTEELSKKKKKKKNKEKDKENISEIINTSKDILEIAEENEFETKGTPSKHKKKKEDKSKVSEKEIPEQEKIFLEIAEENELETKGTPSKHKKKKEEKVSENEIPEEEENLDKTKEKKKKKKKRKHENELTEDVSTVTEVDEVSETKEKKKKKKKKLKDLEKDDETSVNGKIVDDVDFESPKKKLKKLKSLKKHRFADRTM